MELTNQQIRNQKIGQFAMLYGGVASLLLLILYFTTVYIPNLSKHQNDVINKEIGLFVTDARKVDRQITQLDSQSTIDAHSLDPIFVTINQLKSTYSDSIYQKTLLSYQTLLGQLDDVKFVDPDLKILEQQKRQGLDKKIQLMAAINIEKERLKPRPGPNPGGGPPPNPVTPPHANVGTVAAQEWGPYYPKLIKGDGSFGEASPYVKVNLWLTTEENIVKLHIYFEASFNKSSSAGVDSRVETDEVFYTAPKGATIDPASLPKPHNGGWVYGYQDLTHEDEVYTWPKQDVFTCQIKGNTVYRIGDKRSTQLRVRLNRPLSIRYTK